VSDIVGVCIEIAGTIEIAGNFTKITTDSITSMISTDKVIIREHILRGDYG